MTCPENIIKSLREIMDRHWDLAGTDDKHFKTIRTILEDVMAELFTKINLNSDPKLAANDLMKVHNLQKIFGMQNRFSKNWGKDTPSVLLPIAI